MDCWADEEEVFCVHPGGPRLVGADAIRAAFEHMFGNGAIHATPARVRKVESLASAVHNVLERIEVLTAEGPRHAFVLATNVYHKTPQGWRMVAHHASPGSAQEPGDSGRRTPDAFIDGAVRRAPLVARRQPADHLARAVCAACRGPAAGIPARALGHARRRFHRRRFSRCRPAGPEAAAGAVPRPRRLVAQPLCRGLRRLRARRAAGTTRCRISAAAAASSTWRRAPTTRATSRRSAGSSAGCALGATRRRRSMLAAGVSLGGNALMRWTEEAGGEASKLVSAVASISRRSTWRRAAQAIGRGFNRLVYTRMFLSTMKPKALAQAGAASGPVRPRHAARGPQPVRLRQRLHRAAARLSRHGRLLGAGLGQAAPARASASRRWW